MPPTNKLTKISELDLPTPWCFAWLSLDNYPKQSSSYQALNTVLQSANFKTDLNQVVYEGIDVGASFWSNLWKPEEPILIIMGAPWMMKGQAERICLFLTKSNPREYLNCQIFRLIQQWRSSDQFQLTTDESIFDSIRNNSGSIVKTLITAMELQPWKH